MSNIKVYNQDGNVSGEVAVPELFFKKWNASLVHQVFGALAANRRQPIAHTKNRGEVSGGGIKPWRQKGTGRARHGSIRSPLWRHGGVTFGPRNEKDFSQKINSKMAKEALAESLSKKLASNELKVVSALEAPNAKTKELSRAISNLTDKKSTLLVVASDNKNVFRATANLPKLKVTRSKDLNVYDVLNHKYVLMEQKALQEL